MIVVVQTNVLEVTQALDLKAKRLSQVVQDTAKDLGNRVWLDYQRTAETWKHRPKFERIVEIKGDTVTMLVGTDDLIYKFVDKGTKPHFIFPRTPGGSLAFQWGGPGSYKAKTRPGVLGSGGGASSGSTVHFRYVKHPGTEPRRFSEVIQRKYDVMAKQVAEQHIMEWQKE
jgi:hypothetical protein